MVDEFKECAVRFDYKGKPYRFPLSRRVSEPYQVIPRAMFGASILTGEADYANMRPDEIVPLVIQNDFRKGFQDQDYADARKYAHSLDCDARFKGRIMLSPKQQSAISFGNAYVWDGFELWDDANNLTNWPETIAGAGTVLSRDTASKRNGTYCAKLFTTLNGGDLKIVRTFTWDAGYQSKSVTASVYCNLDNTSSCAVKIGITDKAGSTTWSSALGTAGAYTALSVTKTMAADADQLVVTIWMASTTDNDRNLYVDDFNISSTATTGVFLATTPLKTIPFGSSLVTAVGKTLYVSTNGTSVTATYGFESTITDLCVYDNYLWVLFGAAVVPCYTSDLTTFTLSAAYGGESDVTATTKNTAGGLTYYSSSDETVEVTSTALFTAGDYAVWDKGEATEEIVQLDTITDADTFSSVDRGVLGSTAHYHDAGSVLRKISGLAGALYMANSGERICAIADTTTTIRTSDNPINNGTPFSTPITVPNSAYTITGMVDDPNGNTLIDKQDGPYYADEDEAKPSISDTLSDVNTTDTYHSYVWKGYRYCPGGKNKLRRQRLADDLVEDLSITQFAQADGEMDGKVCCMIGDGEYLYLCIDNGSKVEIIARWEENVDGSTSWGWHPIWEITTKDYVSMCVMSFSGTKALYAITGTASDGIDKFTLSQSYSDPLLEVGFEAKASGSFVTPWYATTFVENDKYWDSVWIGGYNFSGYTVIRISYQLEGDGVWTTSTNWTELGDCAVDDSGSITDNGTTRTLVYCKEQVTRFAIEKTSRKIRFKLELKTAQDTLLTDEISPVVTRIRVDGRVEPSLAGTSLRKRNIVCMLSLADMVNHGWNSVKGYMDDLALLEEATEPLDFEGPDCKKRKVRFAQEGLTAKFVQSSAESKSSEFVAVVTLEEG